MSGLQGVEPTEYTFRVVDEEGRIWGGNYSAEWIAQDHIDWVRDRVPEEIVDKLRVQRAPVYHIVGDWEEVSG